MKRLALILASLTLVFYSFIQSSFTADSTSEPGESQITVQSSTLEDVYDHIRIYIFDYWDISQHSSDETFVPTRGADWGDNGRWQELQKHEWGPVSAVSTLQLERFWNDTYLGIETANDFIQEFEVILGQETNVAEARVIRAFFYYQLMDFFGGVPIVTESPLPGQLGPRNTRVEVFDFIVNDIIAASSDLLTENITENYGKIKHWDAQVLLAKLYLNAEVYTGTSRWDECITTCNAIINSGQYSLTTFYFDNFLINNEGSTENMFVIEFSDSDDSDQFPNNHFQMETLHYNQLDDGPFADPSVGSSPWNGFTTVADFYNSFDPADVRLGDISNGQVHQGFLIGQQLDDLDNPLFERDGTTPLIFTLDVPLVDATESEGVRVLKFEADEVSPPGVCRKRFPGIPVCRCVVDEGRSITSKW